MAQASSRTESYTEWRVCGSRASYGPWQSLWRRDEMTRNDEWAAGNCWRNNDEVYIERRSVTVTTDPIERVEVPRPSSLEAEAAG